MTDEAVRRPTQITFVLTMHGSLSVPYMKKCHTLNLTEFIMYGNYDTDF